ncbi:MAG: DUF368 domain-containing protein [Xanthomonadales bacterium]|nr:DUF368 domain-containing protein [Xanthomonadales bacterium]
MNQLFTYFKGMLMGIADLVPGVSGGTIALITGIYERLINAIASANMNTFKLLFKGQIGQAWRQIDGWFLIAVFAGILTSVFLFASLLKMLFANYPVPTWSFFFGLIIASALLLLKKNWVAKPLIWLFLLFGAGLGYVLSTQSLGYLPDGQIGILIAGTIAISAMILPGISGSLILILLGKYQTVLNAVHDRDWFTLIVFAAGCVIGLMVFSRILKWLLKHHHNATLYTLIGLMLGTLFKVWPWKSAEINILPVNHPEPQLLFSVVLMFIASIFVWLLFKLDKKS